LERLGRGFEDVRQGVKQVGTMIGEKAASLALGEKAVSTRRSARTGSDTPAGRGTRALRQGARPDAGMDWMRLAGNVLGTAPISMVGGGAAGLAHALGGRRRPGRGGIGGDVHAGARVEAEADADRRGFGAAMPVVLQGVKLAYGGRRTSSRPTRSIRRRTRRSRKR
jgi:hypothetical protein